MKSVISLALLVVLAAACAAPAQRAATPGTQPAGSSPDAVATQREHDQRVRDRAVASLRFAEKNLTEAEDLVANFTERLRQETGLSNVEGGNLRRLTSSLQEQRENLQLEDAAAVGRRQGIEEAIKTFSDQIRKRAAADDVTSELAKLVDVRQAQLERVRTTQKAGVEKESASDDAQVALATARAELAAARQRAAGSATDAIDAWNRELLNLAVAGQERRAKLQFIHDRLKALQPALADVDRLEQAERERQRMESEFQAAKANVRAIEQ